MNGKSDNTQRIGRFQFALPSSLIATGRSQSMYRVDVNTVPLPAGGADAVWSGRLAAIRTLKRPPGANESIVRTFELEPGVPAVWYHRNPEVAALLALDVMKPYADHVLLASRGVEAGGEPAIEKLLKIVIDGYVPAGQRGFCIGYGALASEPGQNEQTRISFAQASLPEFKITFESNTVREPDPRDPLSDIEQEKRRLAAAGGEVNVLRNQQRRAARLPGIEGWISMRALGEKPFVHFTWRFPGTAGGNAAEPEIIIFGTALIENRIELESAWESMLQSLQPIPFALVQPAR